MESGKLLVENFPASGSFSFFDADDISDELDELNANRVTKAEIIESANQNNLKCGTLEEPCVYELIGLRVFHEPVNHIIIKNDIVAELFSR